MALDRLRVVEGRDKLVICGFCETNRKRVPYDDPSYVIAGLNRGYIFMKRADIWFDVHSPTIRGWNHRRTDKHAAWLRSFRGPVYMHEVDPDIPNSIAYPLDEVQEDIGANLFRIAADMSRTDCRKTPYMDSSMAYELALAIHEGFKEILMVGVDLNTQGEYVWQRSGVSYLMGIAQGRGINVVLPDNCPLLTGPLYGRAYLNPGGEHMSIAQLETRLQALEDEYRHKTDEYSMLRGSAREAKWLSDQMLPGLDHEALSTRIKHIEGTVQQSAMQLKNIEGGIKETLYWIHQTPNGDDEPSDRAQGLQVELNGHNFDESLAEGHLDMLSEISEPEPVLVN